ISPSCYYCAASVFIYRVSPPSRDSCLPAVAPDPVAAAATDGIEPVRILGCWIEHWVDLVSISPGNSTGVGTMIDDIRPTTADRTVAGPVAYGHSPPTPDPAVGRQLANITGGSTVDRAEVRSVLDYVMIPAGYHGIVRTA